MDPERRGGALRVLVGDERGRRVAAAPGLARWLRQVAPARARGTVSVALVSDAHVRRLNRRYRGVDRATDVLSFPTIPQPSLARRPSELRLGSPKRQRREGGDPGRTSHEPAATTLGDIVIARGVARRQARDAGHSELTEWRVLALHGLLHLLGYDHERDGGRMRRVERRLRRRGGLSDGLIDRAERP